MNLEETIQELVAPLPMCAATAVVFHQNNRWHVTIVAKATFAMAQGGELRLVEPEPVAHEDVPHQGNPLRSIRVPRDRVPALAKVDVVVNGDAWAPRGATASVVPVRFVLRSGPHALIDKALVVRADAPFQRLPIVYERAYGGIGAAENPVGTGAREGDPAPNVLHPIDPAIPACFGAVAPHWRSRRALLGTLQRGALREAVLDLPARFSWDFFQAAPPDQRVDRLVGGEQIELYGMSPDHPIFVTRLPPLRGLARIHGLGAHGIPDGQVIALRPDTLRIDADEERCVVGFRGNFHLPELSLLSRLRVVAGVQIHGAPLPWEVVAIPIAPDDEAPASSVTLDEGDVEILDEDTNVGGSALGKTVTLEEGAMLPVAPTPHLGARRAGLDRTVTSIGPSPRARGELPFQAGSSAALIASAPRSRRPKRGVGDTLEVNPTDLDVRPSTPFGRGSVAPPVERSPSVAPPPMAESRVSVAPPVERSPSVPPPMAESRVSVAPPAAQASTPPNGRVYSAEPTSPPEPPAAPPKPVRARSTPGRPPSPPSPKAELREELYGRFGH